MKHFYKEVLSSDYMQAVADRGDFIDAQKGGLLLGNSHDFGGVYMVYSCPNGFMVMGEVEGWEYFLNREISIKYRERLSFINDYYRDKLDFFEEYTPPDKTNLIDARSTQLYTKYILCDTRGGFAIINKHSTKKYIEELNDLNSIGLSIMNQKPYENTIEEEDIEIGGLKLQFHEKKKPWYKRIW